MRISYVFAVVAAAAFTLAVSDTLPLVRSTALAANFSSINGAWRGSGRLKLQDGSSELLRCRAYYNPKDGGHKLGMAVRCASTSYKFEFRSRLTLEGKTVSGSWEERNFNASGTVSGTFQPGKFSLSTTGGMDASMKVKYTSNSQTVTMTGDFGTFKGITLLFSK